MSTFALDQPDLEEDHVENTDHYDASGNVLVPAERRSDVQMLQELAQFGLWLQEVERIATNPLDVCDLTQIYNAADKLQNSSDELRLRRHELDRLREEMHSDESDSPSRKLQRKTAKTEAEAERIGELCTTRQNELEKLIGQMTSFLAARTTAESWLASAKTTIDGAEAVQKLDDSKLRAELEQLERLFGEMPEAKERIAALNEQCANILKHFRRDECHRVSHATSTVNTAWSKFNDDIRIRRAVLEASLTSRKDFDQALQRFESWLSEEHKLVNDRVDTLRDMSGSLVDAASMKTFVDQQHELNAEIKAHIDVFELVNSVGANALDSLQTPEEKQQLKTRLNRVRSDWEQLNGINKVLSERIAAAQNEHDKLESQLNLLLGWVAENTEKLSNEQIVVGDPALIQRQSETIKKLDEAVEVKEKEVEYCLTEVRSYLMRHDLRPTMQSNFLFSHKEDTEDQREAGFVQGVRMQSDCAKLESEWNAFVDRLNLLSQVVRTAHKEIGDLNNALAEALLTLSTLEAKVDKCRVVEKLQLDQLKDAHAEALILTHLIAEGQVRVDDVNDCAGKIQAQNIALSSHLRAQVQAVNQRCRKLKKDLDHRKIAIERALKDFGPASGHFMLGSVKAPWQRAISQTNMLPYFIDHVEKTTQWDHPAMVSVMENLAEFNQVKFCAYRLAMKLRAIQKTACLDLIELSALKTALLKFANRTLSDTIQTDEMTMCLLPLFEDIHARHPELLQSDAVILAVDLTMNLILNIYDPCRDAVTRILSFEVAMVVFCKAELEDKYKYLFQLVSTKNNVDHKQLAILFYELIQIPKFLGEVAAFGGSNIEPSVRSCFSLSHFPNTVTLDDFLKWLKMEPQSFIWLPVLYRLSLSESIKHEAKCNVCKMYPLIGLRYRCMRCLNFDICQNCFFSQRTAKNHKLAHPVLEYCVQTTSKDDLRDFGNILLNKFKHPAQKAGYLSLETVNEGQPVETRKTAPTNPDSEMIHRHIHLFAQRLNKKQRESSKDTPPSQTASEPRPPGPVKSPLQLVLNVVQMEKDELDCLLDKLKRENKTLRSSLNHSRSRLTINAFGGSTPDARRTSTISLSKRRRSIAGGTGFTLNDLGPAPDWNGGRGTPSSVGTAHKEGYSTLPTGASSRPPTTPLFNHANGDNISDRQHQTYSAADYTDYRLEQRQKILVEQNRLLQRQLQRLKKLVKATPDSASPALNGKTFGNYYVADSEGDESDVHISNTRDVDALISTGNEIGQVMESFVVSVANDDAEELFESS
uniref:Dystrophin n=1 Tax=Panagrellus redivivus TaxID=6233 RepID=A0A7E4VK08_PANRE